MAARHYDSVPSGPARERVLLLKSRGMSAEDIARASGCSVTWVRRLTSSQCGSVVVRDFFDALMAVPVPEEPAPADRADVSDLLAAVDALKADGWSVNAVAREAGVDRARLHRAVYVGTARTVPGDLYRAVAALVGRPAPQEAWDRVDATEARDHVSALVAKGWRLASVARAAGLNDGVVNSLMAPSKEGAKALRSTVDAVMAVPLDGPVGPPRDFICAAPAMAQLRLLLAKGWKRSHVARASGLAPKSVCQMADGAPKRCRPRTLDALLSVHGAPPETCPKGMAPAAPVRERLLELFDRGWTQWAVAEACGTTVTTLSSITRERVNRRHVSKALSDAVLALPLDGSPVDGTVPADKGCEHVAALVGAGWRISEIADAAGVDREWVRVLAKNRPARCAKSRLEAVLKVSGDHPERGLPANEVPSAASIEAARQLEFCGWGPVDVERASGVSAHVFRSLLSDDPRPSVRRSTEEALLSLVGTPAPFDGTFLPEAVERRLHALNGLGWSWAGIERACGAGRFWCARVASGACVRVDAEKGARVLAMKEEPPEDPRDMTLEWSTTRARRHVASVLSAGVAPRDVAKMAGVKGPWLASLMDGSASCGPKKLARLLAVQAKGLADAVREDPRAPEELTGTVPAADVRERLAVLNSLGWSRHGIERACGAGAEWCRRVSVGGRERADARNAVRVLRMPVEAPEDPRDMTAEHRAERGREHVALLMGSGMGATEVARRSGVDRSTVAALASGTSGCSVASLSKLLAVAPLVVIDLAKHDPKPADKWTVEEHATLLRVLDVAARTGASERLTLAAVMEACHKDSASATRAIARAREAARRAA